MRNPPWVPLGWGVGALRFLGPPGPWVGVHIKSIDQHQLEYKNKQNKCTFMSEIKSIMRKYH